MRRRALISVAVLICMLLAGARMARATGSLFSGLGYGVIEAFGSSRAAGMGNAGLALEDSAAINFANPALLVGLHRTRISVGGYISRQWMRDHQSSDEDDWAQFEYFAISIPLHRTLSLAALFSPYSRVEFRYGWQGSIGGVPYYQSYQGTGGLSRTALGLAWSSEKWGMVGISASGIWGEVEDLRGSFFDASGYQDVQFVISKQWMAFGGSAGLLLKPLPNLSVGFTFEPEVPIHLDRTYSYSTEDSSVVSERTYRLAARYGMSLAHHLSPAWLGAFQVIYSPWGTVHDLPEDVLSDFRDSYDLALGGEWIPGTWDAERFFNRLQYRFGTRWESGYVASAGSPVRGIFATAGLSYPFRQGRDRFDISIEVGQRGELSANDGQEQIFKLRLGLNLGETWFQRPKPPWQK